MIAALAFLVAAATGGWHDARTIVVPPAAKLPAYVRLALPQEIDGAHDSTYPDVRVVDADGREVPYALDISPQSAKGVEAELSDVGFVPGQFTQAMADAGSPGALYSALWIKTTQPTYFEHVQIATSDDRRTWTVVVQNALIYRVELTDRGTNEVPYGPSRARWIRVRILNGSRQFPILAIGLSGIVEPPQLVPLSNTQSVAESGSNTVVTMDFKTPNTNLGAFAIETTTPQYHRDVAFERPASGDPDWEQFGSSFIDSYRSPRHAETASSAISTGNQNIAALRLIIENGNNAPLAGLRVTPLGYSHHIIFQAMPGAQYRLIWSNADAAAPVYDLGDILQHEPWTVAAVATLGGAASTAFAASSHSATPWLQRAALPIALALLFVVLLAVALIAMRAKPAD